MPEKVSKKFSKICQSQILSFWFKASKLSKQIQSNNSAEGFKKYHYFTINKINEYSVQRPKFWVQKCSSLFTDLYNLFLDNLTATKIKSNCAFADDDDEDRNRNNNNNTAITHMKNKIQIQFIKMKSHISWLEHRNASNWWYHFTTH